MLKTSAAIGPDATVKPAGAVTTPYHADGLARQRHRHSALDDTGVKILVWPHMGSQGEKT